MAEKTYKDSLNLPKTDFPMAANLTQMEPRIRDKWEKEKLYEKIQAARKGAKAWVLHGDETKPLRLVEELHRTFWHRTGMMMHPRRSGTSNSR